MFRTNKIIIFLLGIILMGMGISAQTHPIQERLKAFRVARLDAMRQLGESIKGLHISASTTVKDFAMEQDEVRAHFDSFLRGAEEIERSQSEDGECRVTMVITLDQVISELQRIYEKHPSQQFSPSEINRIRQYTKQRIFYATGIGHIKPDNQSGYWSNVNTTGKLMALRAAKIDAYRKIAERIQGVRISSYTTVRDFVAESDAIRSDFNDFIRGVEFIGKAEFKDEGIVEITAQITIDKLVKALMRINQKHSCSSKWDSRHFYNIYRYTKSTSIRAVGTGVPPMQYVSQNTPVQEADYVVKSYVPQWATQTIHVIGIGQHINASIAFQAAKRDAYHNLMQQIMKLSVQDTSTMRDFVFSNQEIQEKVRNFIESARIVNSQRFSDGTMQVQMELYLGHLWKIIENCYRCNK